ncbi:MAG: pyrroline-5-carboxylate reductase, partial [Clostridia bacterium]|nr:pyrroline-5-carboxylate reductase [Clostridia bacterium]
KIFSVKANVFAELNLEIDKSLLQGKTIISFMAGVTIKEIKDKFKNIKNVLRAMPNLAIQNGNGVMAISVEDENNIIKPDIKLFLEGLFSPLGFVLYINENELEKVTALSACGLGFIAYMMNSMLESGIQLGFSYELSNDIIKQTMLGVLDFNNYNELLNKVATKGGATEAGLKALSDGNVAISINNAFKAAYDKTKNMLD